MRRVSGVTVPSEPSLSPSPGEPTLMPSVPTAPAGPAGSHAALFAPPEAGGWTRIRFALAWKQRLSMLMARLVPTGLIVAAMVIFPQARTWLWVGLAALVVLTAWEWWLKGRWVRNFGYAERGDDLWVTSGAMLRRLTVVPFGRMQLVDVAQGPLDRLFGLAHVQLHTASASTDARIPGLTPDEAARLRDRLTELGAAELSGL